MQNIMQIELPRQPTRINAPNAYINTLAARLKCNRLRSKRVTPVCNWERLAEYWIVAGNFHLALILLMISIILIIFDVSWPTIRRTNQLDWEVSKKLEARLFLARERERKKERRCRGREKEAYHTRRTTVTRKRGQKGRRFCQSFLFFLLFWERIFARRIHSRNRKWRLDLG